MTRDQVNSYIRHVPAFIRQRTGLKELPDLSKERCKKVYYGAGTYNYYPDIPGVLVGERLVMWETGKPDLMDVDVNNVEHFAEILDRGMSFLSDEIIGLADLDPDGRLKIRLIQSANWNPAYHGMVPIDGTKIFYRPENMDLSRDAARRVEAGALFLAKRYNRVFIIPYVDRKPKDWGCCD